MIVALLYSIRRKELPIEFSRKVEFVIPVKVGAFVVQKEIFGKSAEIKLFLHKPDTLQSFFESI